jgi:hypothetical protein
MNIYIIDIINKAQVTCFVGCSGIPFSCSSSACVFPHIALVTEKLAVRGIPVCSLETGPEVRDRFLNSMKTINRVDIKQK